ncbi:MAG TPA: polysaccharide biosynthesis/export family protein [Gemmata sp.]|nr:polysaccharide biosynthesis/export family protein [Gemmata sp.]
MSRTAILRIVFLAFAVSGAGGCAGITNPVADGIPVRRLPEEILGRPRTELKELPLNLLRITNPGDYKLDKGDVLAIVADEIVTKENQPIPVQFLQSLNTTKAAVQGVPVPVQDDGTIRLPYLDPIDVRGKTLIEVQDLITDQMVNKKQIVVKGKERVMVDLLQPRRYRVLVVREDSQPIQNVYAMASSTAAVVGGNKRGSAFSLSLEPGRNDLLQALTQTGGPPGVDAQNEVVIRRGKYDPADPAKGYVRIPLRLRVDQPITFTEGDITLDDGDTVYIAARDTEVYYTAGLLGAAQIPLPRDYDLRVIEAITQVRGPLINGSFNQNAFVASAVNTGIGNPNASLVTVLRRLPNQQQIRIRVDLNEAFRDLRENILIQPGDIVVLQERPGESLARYFTQTFRLSTTWQTVFGRQFFQFANSNNP